MGTVRTMRTMRRVGSVRAVGGVRSMGRVRAVGGVRAVGAVRAGGLGYIRFHDASQTDTDRQNTHGDLSRVLFIDTPLFGS